MAKRSEKNNKQVNLRDYLVVTYVQSVDIAKEYELLLNTNDIPAMIKENYKDAVNNEIAVMVPEEYFDEAQVIIESQQVYDDIYDYAIDDDDDFDSDFHFDEY